MSGPLDLTNEKISFTFERLIQTDGVGNFYNGLGDPVAIGGSGSGEFFYQNTTPTATVLGARWINSDTGVEYVWVFDGDNNLWMQPTQVANIQYQATQISTSTYSSTFTYTYHGVVYTGGICTISLPVGSSPLDDGKIITIADEVGGISSYNRGIQVNGSGGQLINGNSGILMKLEMMSLTFLFRNNQWKTI